MLLPNLLIGFMIILIGFVPFIFMKPLANILTILLPNTESINQIIPTLNHISLSSGIFVGLIGLLWVLRSWQQKKQTIKQEPTWGCGYTGANPALHQYTATSYADNFVQLSSKLVNVRKEYTNFKVDEIFPQEREFETHSSDIFEDNLISTPSNKILKWIKQIAVFQTGKIQHYLLYALVFLAIIFLLTYLNWI